MELTPKAMRAYDGRRTESIDQRVPASGDTAPGRLRDVVAAARSALTGAPPLELTVRPLVGSAGPFASASDGAAQSAVRGAELPPLSRSAGYLAPVGSRVVPDGSG